MNAQLITNLKLTPNYLKLIKAIGKKLEPTLKFEEVEGVNRLGGYNRNITEKAQVIRVTTDAIPSFQADFVLETLYEVPLKQPKPITFWEAELNPAWEHLQANFPQLTKAVFNSKTQRFKTKSKYYLALDGNRLYFSIDGHMLFYTPYASTLTGIYSIETWAVVKFTTEKNENWLKQLVDQHVKQEAVVAIPIDKSLKGFLSLCDNTHVTELSTVHHLLPEGVDPRGRISHTTTISNGVKPTQNRQALCVPPLPADLTMKTNLGYRIFKPTSLEFTRLPLAKNDHVLGSILADGTGYFDMPYTVKKEGN